MCVEINLQCEDCEDFYTLASSTQCTETHCSPCAAQRQSATPWQDSAIWIATAVLCVIGLVLLG